MKCFLLWKSRLCLSLGRSDCYELSNGRKDTLLNGGIMLD